MFFRWKGRRGSIEGRTLTFQSCLLLWIQKREDLELVLVLVCCLDLTRRWYLVHWCVVVAAVQLWLLVWERLYPLGWVSTPTYARSTFIRRTMWQMIQQGAGGAETPDQKLPDWAQQINEANFEPLDARLSQAGVDDASIARLPRPTSLPTPPVSPLSVRQTTSSSTEEDRTFRGGDTGSSGFKPPVAAFSGSPWLPKTALTVTALQLLSAIPRSQFILPTGKSWDDVGHLPGPFGPVFWSEGFC